MIKRIVLSTLSAVLLFAFGAVGHAQLLIYDLSLSKTGTSVNYTFFQNGFLVVDTAASSFSSVIVLTDPNTFNYYQAPSLIEGSYNTIQDYTGKQNAIMFGASVAATTGDSGALQLVGAIDKHAVVGEEMRANLSKKLTGYLLASGTQVNASTKNGTQTALEYGFAGSSKATAEYNSHLTRDVNNKGFASANALNYLGQLLTRKGVLGGPSPTPTPSPTP